MSNDIKIGKLLQNVLDEMLEGVQVVSPEWKYLYVNETVARQARSVRENLVGRTMMECFPGIDTTPLFTELRKAMKDRVSIRMENEFEYPDGEKGWFQLYIHPVNEGLMILSVDVTERKKIEHKLEDKVNELERWSKVFVGRELKMVELKDRVSELKSLVPQLSPQAEEIDRTKMF